MNNQINLQNVPQKPGCYLWKDKNNNVIYVGKAKNLKTRMSQYFNKNYNYYPKTKILVNQISDYDYQLVDNEREALLLELNLIKKYNPKFNIRLKDIRTYPYLCLSKNPRIKLEISYKFKKDKNVKCYGPFPEGFGTNRMKKLLESIFPINKCLNENINKSGQPCLNYQINLCLGYCMKSETELKIARDKVFNQIDEVLLGKTKLLKKLLLKKIEYYTNLQMFEQANKIYQSYTIIDKYEEKQNIIFQTTKSIDFISWAYKNNVLSITFFYIRNGILANITSHLIESFSLDFKETLINYLNSYYQQNFVPDFIYFDKQDNVFSSKDFLLKFYFPQIGDKLMLLEKTRKEAKNFLNNEYKIFMLKANEEQKYLVKLKEFLNVDNLDYIEMIDISNFGEKNPIGAVVGFKNLLVDYSSFRFYYLNDGQNDYQKIYETTYQHFRQKLIKNEQMPNILFIDGKYQINNAKKALNDLEITNIIIFGLVKNSKHKTSYLINIENNLYNINDDRILFKLQQIQEQAHDYVIRKFRDKKIKEILNNG